MKCLSKEKILNLQKLYKYQVIQVNAYAWHRKYTNIRGMSKNCHVTLFSESKKQEDETCHKGSK